MKRKLVLLLTCVLLCTSLSACTADDINTAIDKAGEKLQEVEIKQEDLDKAEEAVDVFKDSMKEIIEDEDVQEALKSGVDRIDEIINEDASTE